MSSFLTRGRAVVGLFSRRKGKNRRSPSTVSPYDTGCVSVRNTEGDGTRTSRYPSAREGTTRFCRFFERTELCLGFQLAGEGDQSARLHGGETRVSSVDAYPEANSVRERNAFRLFNSGDRYNDRTIWFS